MVGAGVFSAEFTKRTEKSVMPNPRATSVPSTMAINVATEAICSDSSAIGSATAEGREDSGHKVIANIRMWADGHRPPDQVLTALVRG